MEPQKVELKPLTYIEVEQDLPLNIKLDEDHMFTCNLQIAQSFVLFNSNKNMILSRLDQLNGLERNDDTVNIAKIECLKALVYNLYDISKPKQKEKEKAKKYDNRCADWYNYLDNLFMNDITLLYSVFEKVLRYNSDLKKKALSLQNFEIYQSDVSMETAGGVPLKDLIVVDPITGEKSFKH